MYGFNDDSYLFFSVVSDTEKYDENVYHLKLVSHFYDFEKVFYLSINPDEADFINDMLLEFRALVLGLKSTSDFCGGEKND